MSPAWAASHISRICVADDVRGDEDAAGAAELEDAQEGVVVAGEDREALDRAELVVVGLLDGDDVVDLRRARRAARVGMLMTTREGMLYITIGSSGTAAATASKWARRPARFGLL